MTTTHNITTCPNHTYILIYIYEYLQIWPTIGTLRLFTNIAPSLLQLIHLLAKLVIDQSIFLAEADTLQSVLNRLLTIWLLVQYPNFESDKPAIIQLFSDWLKADPRSSPTYLTCLLPIGRDQFSQHFRLMQNLIPYNKLSCSELPLQIKLAPFF